MSLSTWSNVKTGHMESWHSTLIHIFAGLSIWMLLEGFLYLTYGRSGPLTQMGWFFTKAALVTFGGAYAVLP